MGESGTEFRKLAAIMFTDMVGYSAIAQRNEALALELLEDQRRIIRHALPEYHGDEIKTMGDGFLVEFPSALAAVRCAVRIQREIAERNSRTAAPKHVLLRIGIHLGDIVRRENDVVGDGVNIAARIEPMAAPGGICLSEDVARQIQNKVDQSLVRLGPGELKNIQLPVVIYKLEPTEENGTAGFSRSSIRPPTTMETLVGLARSARLALLLGALTICLGLVTIAWSGHNNKTNPSVAVLPLASVSSESDNQHLSDGLTDELIANFGRLGGLHVVSRSTSFSYKGRSENAMRVGQDLGVRHILAGSVRRSGTDVRVNIELVKTADGYQAWSETFDGSATNALALQAQIAKRVVAAVKDIVLPDEAIGGVGAMQVSRID